jgi:hypothetical protein
MAFGQTAQSSERLRAKRRKVVDPQGIDLAHRVPLIGWFARPDASTTLSGAYARAPHRVAKPLPMIGSSPSHLQMTGESGATIPPHNVSVP